PARFLHADVEPYRRVEARLLREHQVSEFAAEIFEVLRTGEVAVLFAPAGDGVHDALHQLRHAGLALRRPKLAVEVLAGDDVGRGLRPIDGNFDVALFEDDGAFIVADRGGTRLPLDFVVRVLTGFQPGRKVSRERNSRL